MESHFYYRDEDLFVHHTLDKHPTPDSFPCTPMSVWKYSTFSLAAALI